MSDPNKKYKNAGVIGTIIFHGALILAFLFFGMGYQIPPPEEEGVEVNLGYSDQGMGQEQEINPAETAAPQPEETASSEEEIVTNEDPESVKLTDTKKETTKEKPKEVVKEVVKETPKQQVNKNALFKKSNKKGGSEGITGYEGNQGNPNGDPASKSYTGNSPSGNGVSYSLTGRSGRQLPKPVYNVQEEGIVVVEIKVDQQGKVIFVRGGVKGSNTNSSRLIKAAEDAAKRSLFNVDLNAAIQQRGFITYRFNLN